jgi:hypothetical protein
MTEVEWLTCTDPGSMLKYLRANGQASDRKLRLFEVACCRRIELLPKEGRSDDAVKIAERAADGLCDARELARAERLAVYASRAAVDRGADASICRARLAAQCAVNPQTINAANDTSLVAREAGVGFDIQAILVRDLWGNPHRPARVAPNWLRWNDAILAKLAEAIYADYSFNWLPILADALEEAGCTHSDFLNHCRQPGEHVRGCWVIDLILGKS